MKTDKGMIRSMNRKGVRSGKAGTEKSGPGRVVLRGKYAELNEGAIVKRLEHVAERQRGKGFESPLLSFERTADGLEVVTESQELAQRLARELKKAFHGEATYKWSDGDRSLRATWERDV